MDNNLKVSLDDVKEPAHYANYNIQPIDAIASWGLDFDCGNVVKYIVRAEHKGTMLQDYYKALEYLQHKIKTIELDNLTVDDVNKKDIFKDIIIESAGEKYSIDFDCKD